MPKVRATFLLQCVIVAGCLALFLGVLAIGLGSRWIAATLVLAAVIWLVGIDWLPVAIEHIVSRRATRSGKPKSSIWFVDLDRQRSRQMDDFQDDSRNNPTLR